MGRGWPTSGEDLISGLRIRSGPGACCCSCWIDSQADVRLSSRACRPPVRWCGRGRERTGKEGGRKPTHVALCARCMEWRGWPRAAGWAPPSSPSAGSPGMSDRGGGLRPSWAVLDRKPQMQLSPQRGLACTILVQLIRPLVSCVGRTGILRVSGEGLFLIPMLGPTSVPSQSAH